MYTKNEIYQLVAMSVPKRCICVVVFTIGITNPSDFSVRYRIIYFFVEFYYYSQNGLLSLEFDISRGVHFLFCRY
jgi:hypothetical protein